MDIDKQVSTDSVSLEEVVSLAHRLSFRDKLQLVARVLPDLEQVMEQQEPTRRRSLLGICADLGAAPSEEDIDAVREEVWQNFPREMR